MFGIGFQELVLLSLIGLIVLGPEKLPRVANQLGSWLGQARRMTRVMKRQLEDEINFEKDFSIKPQSREPSTQPPPVTPRDDDHHSEAHAAGETGTAADWTDDDTSEKHDEPAVTTAEHDEPAAATAEHDDAAPPAGEAADAGEADVPKEQIAKEAS